MNESDLSANELLSEIRDKNREECRDRREQSKQIIWKRKRLKLSEIEKSLQDISLHEFQELALSVKKSKPNLETLRKIKRGACGGKEHIQAFFKVDGAYNAIVSALLSKDGERQLEAAAVLTNLACGSHKSAHKIAKMTGAYLISYINGGSHFLQDQCAWATGNIAEDCDICFGVLKAQGLLPAIVNLLKSPIPNVVQSAAFCLSACTAYYEDADVIEIVRSNAVELLLKIMQQQTVEQTILIEVCTALSNCCFIIALHKIDITNVVIAETVLKYLEKEMKSESVNVLIVTPLMRCLGYICGASDVICKYLTSLNVLKELVMKTMSSQFHHLKKELLWVLANILGSNEAALDLTIVHLVLEKISVFLNPIDSAVLQALYFLYVLAGRGINQLSLANPVYEQIQLLAKCNKKDIEEAANILLAICKPNNSV